MITGMVRVVLIVVCALSVVSGRAVDTERFGIWKGVHYFQISEGIAHLQTNNMYRFTAQVYANEVGDVLGSSLATPKFSRIDLLPDNSGDPFVFKDKFDDQFGLERNFPNGNYQLGIRGLHDGDHTMSFVISGDAYPVAPVVNNFEGLKNLVYNKYNVISWQAFAGGTANDFIQVQIEDPSEKNVWETPDFGEDGALDGLATRTILPPGTLAPGVVYTATIRFVKVLASGSPAYPGAVGTVGYFTRTEFLIHAKTGALDPAVDRLQIWRRHRYEQFANGLMTEQEAPWQFESKLDATGPNQITAARLVLPNGSTNDFVPDETFTEFEVSSPPLTNQTAFASIYQDGAYKFEIAKADTSVLRPTINLPAGSFPTAPRLLNLASMTNHPAGQPITVSWQPWVGAGELDFIRVELSDDDDGRVWDTSNYSSAKHLRSDETSVTIAGTNFIAGHDYTVEVHFYHVNVSDTDVIPGALVFGGFDTRTKFEFSTQLPDVPSFRVAEGQYLWQRGTNRYEADPLGQFRFEARATMATATSLRGAQVTTPKNETFPLARAGTNLFFQYIANEGSVAALAQRYPTGFYTMTFDTQFDGGRTASVLLPTTDLPPVPYVLNLHKMETNRNSADFPINWLPWNGANTNTDRIQFTLVDLANRVIIDTTDSATKHALTAHSTNITIFGNDQDQRELAPNRSYIARLRFERRARAESLTYPGARGTAAVFSEVAFYLSTFDSRNTYRSGATFDRTNGVVQVRVGTFPQIGRTYGVYESSDLQAWNFIRTETVTTNNVILFTTPPTGSGPFYKTVLLP